MKKQLELGVQPVYKWGGRRPGAGRPKSGRRVGVSHRARPWHNRNHPVHVTWRFVPGLPSMRKRELAGAIGRTFRSITQSHAARGTGFRIIHFSIMADHLHLMVEAGGKKTLIKGLRGLGTWIGRRVNETLGRRGRVLGDRYHARALTKPREVRNAIVYVLQNHMHHEPSRFLVDENSSGMWFDGWAEPIPRPPTPPPTAEALTWLGRVGWRRHGLIRFEEAPAS